jgi:hypothetical protein
METIEIKSVAHLSELVDDKFDDEDNTTVIYRGLKDFVKYKLQPKVGRPDVRFDGKKLTPKNEERIFEFFKRRYVGLATLNPADKWELLAIAQHHGLPTRLMDWTRNPLVAAYFAVQKKFEGDSVIYAWRCQKEFLSKTLPSPFKIDKVTRYIPRFIDTRIRAQSGLFTAHPYPYSPLQEPGLVQLRFPNKDELRKQIKRSLWRLGVDEATMFPDLDGLARHIEWLQTDCH